MEQNKTVEEVVQRHGEESRVLLRGDGSQGRRSHSLRGGDGWTLIPGEGHSLKGAHKLFRTAQSVRTYICE